MRRYRPVVREQILPILDPSARIVRRLLRDIFPHEVGDLLDQLVQDGAPLSSVQLAESVLRQLIQHAVAAGELGYNPVVEFRRRRKPE